LSLLQNSNAISTGLTGYNLESSLRFRNSASAYLSRTPASAGSTTTGTISTWFKIGSNVGGILFEQGNGTNTNRVGIWVSVTTSKLQGYVIVGGTTYSVISNAVLRDYSAWYHVVLTVDTTNSTAGDRLRLYLNGERISLGTDQASSIPQNQVTQLNGTGPSRIGYNQYATSYYFDGYMTEFNLVDGQALTADDFGEYDDTTGVWKPKEYTGTYGTNGFYLPMKETQQATGFNTVLWTGNGGTQSISNVGFSPDLVWVKSRSASFLNVLSDTVRGSTKYLYSDTTGSEGTAVDGITSFDSDGFSLKGNIALNGSGHTYVGWCWDAGNSGQDYGASLNGSTQFLGFASSSSLAFGTADYTIEGWIKHNSNAKLEGIVGATGGSLQLLIQTNGTLIGSLAGGSNFSTASTTAVPLDKWTHIALVRSSGTFTYYINGVASGTGTDSNNYTATGVTVNIGTTNNSSTFGFNGSLSNFRIVKGSAVYTGNFTPPTSALTAVTNTEILTLQDATLVDNSANGYSITNNGSIKTGIVFPYIQDNNTDGTITSSVRANPATGFSVVTYTGNGTAGATVGHGLSSAPKMIIVKNRSISSNWHVYHESIGATKGLILNLTNAEATSTLFWNNTAPTSSVFSLGTYGGGNGSGNNLVAYCFSEVAGYSKFGSYTGNGSTSGPTVTTGFRPAFVMFKRSDSTANWTIRDNTREPNNTNNKRGLFPNATYAEDTTAGREVDFNDDGFQIKGTDSDLNTSGGTYIYMAFADTRDAQFNFDASGNKNNWTPNNINSNASSETTYDIMNDVATLTDEDTANFATWNPLNVATNITTTNANLSFNATTTSGNHRMVRATHGMTSGKYYWEVNVNNSSNVDIVGVSSMDFNGNPLNNYVGGHSASAGYGYSTSTGSWYGNGFTINGATPPAFPSSGIIGVAFDADNGELYFHRNGTWINSANPSAGTGSNFTASTTQSGYLPAISTYNNQGTWSVNFGQRPFKYTPPTGYKKLNTYNLPDSTIVDGSQYMNPVLWSGNGTSQSITGVGFEPDLVWTKERTSTSSNLLIDSVRGANIYLASNTTDDERVVTNAISSFDSDGFTVGNSGGWNQSGQTYVGWSWRGSDSSAVSNTDGTITSTVSANTDSGFSVVTYTGNGTNGATIGHGLGNAPEWVIVKRRDSAGDDWLHYHKSLGATKSIAFDTNGAITSSTRWNNTTPSSSVITLGTSTGVNGSGATYVAYCFSDVEGFSKFGSYTGNGSTDGPFVYTGFRPAFIMTKCSSSGGEWEMYDTSRGSYNAITSTLEAQSSTSELNYYTIDILSNGFKQRNYYNTQNQSGATFIYMAFAEHPFKHSLAR
jgi:hypothetical protein